jgi:hypothetical protein
MPVWPIAEGILEYSLHRTLQAENGDIFYFDPVGERFVDALDASTVKPTPSEQIEAGTPEPPYPTP